MALERHFNELARSGFESTKYSDLTVVANDRRFRVHRIIVCPLSKFFAAACDGKFEEASTGIINLDDDDPAAIEAMLRHFYRPEDPYRNPSENESLVVEAHVYGVADKYDVPELKESSRQNFRRILLDDYTETVEKELLPTVRIVFTTTGEDDRGLRSLVLTKALTEIRKLKQDPGFDTLLKEVPQFTAELFQMFLVNWDRGTETCYACHVGRARLTYKGFTCQKCGHDFKIGVKTGEREAKE